MWHEKRPSGFKILLAALLGPLFLAAPAAGDGLQIVARFVDTPLLTVDPHSALWQQASALRSP